MSKVRWGIISTAKIATGKVIPAMQQTKNCAIVAIASRDLESAKQVAEQLQIPKAYGSYEELLSDDEIDAVYNPLPNHLHVPWSIKAIEAGKHVLCEKPIALNSTEAEEIVHVAQGYPGIKVMEAFMYRHHPQWKKAKELLKSGKIGKLRTVQTFFSFFNKDPGNIRNQADCGGGALLDLGCYPVSLSRFLFNGEPQRVCAIAEYDPDLAVDSMFSGVLEFAQGTSSFTCSTQLTHYQRVNIVGTEGRIEIEIPFNAPTVRPCRIWHQFGDKTDEIEFPIANQYTIQGELFSQAIVDDTEVPTPIGDALANMRTIDALFESALKGTWVKPAQ